MKKKANFAAKAEDEKHDDFLPKSTAKQGRIFNSLPPPKSSLFNSLPPPKLESFASPMPQAESSSSKPKSSSSLFSSLPQPKSSSASASSSSAASKRFVQFKPPSMVNLRSTGVDDEDDSDDEGEKEKQRKKLKESLSTASPSSFLSSIPAPRHSAALGAMPSALGSGRRSIVETDNPVSSLNTVSTAASDANANFNVGHSSDQPNEMNYDYSTWGSGNASHAYYPDAGVNSNAEHSGDQSHNYDRSSSLGGENYAYYSGYGVGSADVNSVGSDYSYGNGHVEYANYGGSYGDYGNGAHHGYNYTNATALPEVLGDVGNALRLPGKREGKIIHQK